MTKIGKRLAAVFLAVAMVVTFMPVLGTQTAYAADDTRTEITEIVATSNIVTPVYGAEIPEPIVTVETGSPAWFHGVEWLKKTGDDWEVVEGGTFTSGTYQCSGMIRISDGGTEYKLGWPITVTVDGTEWTTGWDGPEVYDTWSRLGIGSPEYIVTAPLDAPLAFSDKSSYDIGKTYTGQAISEYSVASSAEGGKTPYVFSKTSGPSWLSVSSDGVVSGTPTEAGSNEDLVIRVTDANGDYAEIFIAVASTVMDPADRTEITEIIATSNIVTPVYGAEIPEPIVTVETGSPAWFHGVEWLKKTGDDWEVVEGGTFTSGTYQCSGMIRISDGGTEYKLGWPITVTVDGTEWTTGWDGPEVYDTLSRLGIGSPEYIVHDPIDVPTGKTLTYTGKTQTGVPSGTGYTVSGTKSAANAGTYKATVTPDAGYCWADGTTDDKTVTWKITPKKIIPAVTLSASAYTWNGKVRKPTVTVKDGSTKLAASDYTVTYKNNKNVGKASAVVTLKGNYSGSKTVTFKINPKGTSLSKVTKAKKAVTVKWTKQSTKMSSSRITGYQIQLATNSKFTKNKKLVTVKGYKKTSKKVTKLKGGKKYYVRVRTYQIVNGSKYYSPWSKAKTVTTKK